jgi:hypothetical protein
MVTASRGCGSNTQPASKSSRPLLITALSVAYIDQSDAFQ